MGEGEGARSEAEENDVGSGPQEDRGGSKSAVGKGEEGGVKEAGAAGRAVVRMSVG
jgi:hypothetical protein